MRVGLIGSVGTSLLTLEKLIEHAFNVVSVWGYEPENTTNISGYHSLKELAENNSIQYYPYDKINSCETKKQIKSSKLDLLFVIGISQLVDIDVINCPKFGCVGFHPTLLPKGRGRAPGAWLILKESIGAATFFKIDEKADSGAIYVQEPFFISETDDATSISKKVHEKLKLALDRWLPKLLAGNMESIPQQQCDATYYAKRTPVDGCIDWYDSSKNIDRLIKATTHPHPGAYSFWGDYKVLIWKSSYYWKGFPIGVVGRIVDFNNNHPIVQAGNGYIEIVEYEIVDANNGISLQTLSIGSRLGYYEQYEIFKLRNEIAEIKKKIKKLLDE